VFACETGKDRTFFHIAVAIERSFAERMLYTK
jgi:hypothetical protein